jgi:prepilin-type processing-associated H-X9-DG protein
MSRARATKCASNLHQISQAMITFAGDNNGNLPTSGAAIPYNSTDVAPPQGSGLNGWTQQLELYLGGQGAAAEKGSGSIFQCPDWQKVTAGSGSIYPNKYYSYFNGSHAADPTGSHGGFKPVSLMKIREPSMHIIAGDIAFPVFYELNDGLDDCDKDDYGLNNPAFNGGTIPIHNGYVNLAFADGHVERASSYDNTKMTTHYDGIESNASYTDP